MNCKLSDQQIQSTCQTLLDQGLRPSGRALRRELRRRFGASGNTDRIFRVWRHLTEAHAGAGEGALGKDAVGEGAVVPELRHRAAVAEARASVAEAARDAALRRAELAELREVAHQDKTAYEIYDLRVEVQRLSGLGGRCAQLERDNLRLHQELMRLRMRI